MTVEIDASGPYHQQERLIGKVERTGRLGLRVRTDTFNHLLSVLHILALILIIFSSSMLMPVVVSWALNDRAHGAYVEEISLSLGTGVLV